MATKQQTSSRKKDHVDLCVGSDVIFHEKSTGFERIDFVHNALPELNPEDISTTTSFLNKPASLPLMVSCMTGGYAEAERINRELAEICEELDIPLGVGSQRQALESSIHHDSFRVVRSAAPSIAIVGNIGAAEVAKPGFEQKAQRIIDLIQADALTVHLNPLQELLQPEGNPTFRGVLQGIERLVRHLAIPVVVKEVGAGISGKVAMRLLDAGVSVIDVAGAGGTSWAGVEILRNEERAAVEPFWDWGIPTVECLRQITPLKSQHSFTLVASGGVASGLDMAKSLALGADMAASARIFLKTLMEEGQLALVGQIRLWQQHLRTVMFLTGSSTIQELQQAELLYRPRET